MEIFEGLSFERVTRDDVDALTAIMKRAFDEDTRRHLGGEAGGPPGYDDGSFIRRWFFHAGAQAYKVMGEDGAIIGAINLFISDSQVNNLGCMFVDPLCQDKGVGTKMWGFAEHKYPATKKWRTETPGFSKRNHNFYVNKCGFHVVRIENPKDHYAESYILEKIMNQ